MTRSSEYLSGYEAATEHACAILEQSDMGAITDPVLRAAAVLISKATAATLRMYARQDALGARTDDVDKARAAAAAHDEAVAYASVLKLRSTKASQRSVRHTAQSALADAHAAFERAADTHEAALFLDTAVAWAAVLDLITPAEPPVT